MKEIDPYEINRDRAFEKWNSAPQPMVTLIKTFNVKNLVKISKKQDLKFNMLMGYCIAKAASQVKEFYYLPVENKLCAFKEIAVDLIVKTKDGTIHSCSIPFNKNLAEFNKNYLELTAKVFNSNEDYELDDSYMVIGTSALKNVYLDGAINMYSGVFNNPFLIWGKHKRKKKKIKLPVSFQFHHVQMDGEEAGRFLNLLKEIIKKLRIKDIWS